ncbi:MAG: aldehyde dehydrogenase family protein [Bryocella sp.]
MFNRIEIGRRAQSGWAALSVRERNAALCRLRHLISAQIDTIVATISAEVGKPPLDALAGDVMTVLECMRYHERCAAKVLRRKKVCKPAFLFRGSSFWEKPEPYGVVLIVAPWNYPFQLAMVPAVTALLAGNAIILKCSEHAPNTAKTIAALFRDAGFADELVQVTSDTPEIVSEYIAQQPDLIFFTGSSKSGHSVAALAAKFLIPAVLELGGKDACLVFESCDLRRAIEGVCYAAFSNAGQVCVGAKRVYVQRGVWEKFQSGFVERAQQVRIGSDFDSDMGPVQYSFVRERLAAQIDDALCKGAVLHTNWDRTSHAVPPLILTSVTDDAELLVEESFGPVVCLAPFDSEEDAVQIANASSFGLSASIYTGDREQGRRVASALHVGSCTVNDSIRHVGNPFAVFGGNGQSGYGRYHGAAGLLAFSRMKTVMEVDKLKAHEVHWFPFQRSTYTGLRGLLLARHGNGSLFARLRNILQINSRHQ